MRDQKNIIRALELVDFEGQRSDCLAGLEIPELTLIDDFL